MLDLEGSIGFPTSQSAGPLSSPLELVLESVPQRECLSSEPGQYCILTPEFMLAVYTTRVFQPYSISTARGKDYSARDLLVPYFTSSDKEEGKNIA